MRKLPLYASLCALSCAAIGLTIARAQAPEVSALDTEAPEEALEALEAQEETAQAEVAQTAPAPQRSPNHAAASVSTLTAIHAIDQDYVRDPWAGEPMIEAGAISTLEVVRGRCSAEICDPWASQEHHARAQPAPRRADAPLTQPQHDMVRDPWR